jgi:hypothetical protein
MQRSTIQTVATDHISQLSFINSTCGCTDTTRKMTTHKALHNFFLLYVRSRLLLKVRSIYGGGAYRLKAGLPLVALVSLLSALAVAIADH